MNTLVFFSQKGGSGKTTLAIHIAVAAQERGEKVVLIDCDPQESAARWGISREQDTPFVAKASPENINQVIMAALMHAIRWLFSIVPLTFQQEPCPCSLRRITSSFPASLRP